MKGLSDLLDELESINSRIRYYRFYKVLNGYIFKTFIDSKDGTSGQYTGEGATRIEAVFAAIDNIKADKKTVSTYTKKYKQRVKNDRT